MKALVGAFNQEKALVGAFSVIVQLHRLIDLRRHYSRQSPELTVTFLPTELGGMGVLVVWSKVKIRHEKEYKQNIKS